MNVSIYLADYVQGAPGQKANIIGLGWNRMTTPLPPHGVIVLLDLVVEDLVQEYAVKVELVGDDGQPTTDSNGDAIYINAVFQPSAPDGPQPPVTAPIAFNVNGGVPLEPGTYAWQVEVNGEQCEDWSRTFVVAQAEPTGEPTETDS